MEGSAEENGSPPVWKKSRTLHCNPWWGPLQQQQRKSGVTQVIFNSLFTQLNYKDSASTRVSNKSPTLIKSKEILGLLVHSQASKFFGRYSFETLIANPDIFFPHKHLNTGCSKWHVHLLDQNPAVKTSTDRSMCSLLDANTDLPCSAWGGLPPS